MKWLGRTPDFYDFLRDVLANTRSIRNRTGLRDVRRLLGSQRFTTACFAPAGRPDVGEALRRRRAATAAASIASRRTRARRAGSADRYEARISTRRSVFATARQANNPWLQELPDPVDQGDVGQLCGDRAGARRPLWVWPAATSSRSQPKRRRESSCRSHVQPGQSPTHDVGRASATAGRGRDESARASASTLFPLAASVGGVRRYRPGRSRGDPHRPASQPLAATQTHHSMEGRARSSRRRPRGVPRRRVGRRAASATRCRRSGPSARRGEHQWGMAIDLNACTGCSACVIACQAENNVPVVGQGRGPPRARDALDPHRPLLPRRRGRPGTVVHQPMMCQHCEHAPCETGVPGARHRAQLRRAQPAGLQPLRRHALLREQLPVQGAALQLVQLRATTQFDFNMNNPLGTHGAQSRRRRCASRGVMEKCSLCVQRIQAGNARSTTGAAGRADGDIKTACQQVCPARGDRVRRPQRSGRAGSHGSPEPRDATACSRSSAPGRASAT